MKEQIVTMRKQLDALAVLMENLTSEERISRWVRKAHESILIGRAWLGKVLKEMGEESPYKKDGRRKRVEDIEPASDKAGITDYPKLPDEWAIDIGNVSYVEKIDFLREKIGEIAKDLKGMVFVDWFDAPLHYLFFFGEHSYSHLTEARFWLGYELQRIKELNEKEIEE